MPYFGLIPPILRTQLEYPTYGVNFIYLSAIEKIQLLSSPSNTLTSDQFSDKAIQKFLTASTSNNSDKLIGRNSSTAYYCYFTTTPVLEIDYGSTVLGTSTSFTNNTIHLVTFDIIGSTLKGIVDGTVVVSVTNTNLTSGYYGINTYPTFNVYLQQASTPLPPAQAVIEANITGSNTPTDPIRPVFSTSNPPISWGTFDYKGENTMILILRGDATAVANEVNFAQSKNLFTSTVPSDITGVTTLLQTLKTNRPNMIAGRHDLAYQTLGNEEFEWLAVADFYNGFNTGTYNIKDLSNVPTFELRNNLTAYINKLSDPTLNISPTDRTTHIQRIQQLMSTLGLT